MRLRQRQVEGVSDPLGLALRIERVAASWNETPYLDAPRPRKGRGGGVNCVGFIVSCYDELSGTQTPVDQLPADACLHDREGATRAMLRIARLCQADVVRLWRRDEPDPGDVEVEPGDVIAAGPRDGGPGHGILVGGHPGRLWHATLSGVCSTGMSAGRMVVFGVFRVRHKATW